MKFKKNHNPQKLFEPKFGADSELVIMEKKTYIYTLLIAKINYRILIFDFFAL